MASSINKITRLALYYTLPALENGSGKPRFDASKMYNEGATVRFPHCSMYYLSVKKTLKGPYEVKPESNNTDFTFVTFPESDPLLVKTEYSILLTRKPKETLNKYASKYPNLMSNSYYHMKINYSDEGYVILDTVSAWRLIVEDIESNRTFASTVTELIRIYRETGDDEPAVLLRKNRFITLPDNTDKSITQKNTSIILDMLIFLEALDALLSNQQWEKPLLDIIDQVMQPSEDGTLTVAARWKKAARDKGGEFVCYALFTAYTFYQKHAADINRGIPLSIVLGSFLYNVKRTVYIVEQTMSYLADMTKPLGNKGSNTPVSLTRTLVQNSVLFSPVSVNKADNRYWEANEKAVQDIPESWDDNIISTYILRKARGDKNVDFSFVGRQYFDLSMETFAITDRSFPKSQTTGFSETHIRSYLIPKKTKQKPEKISHFMNAIEYRDSNNLLREEIASYIDVSQIPQEIIGTSRKPEYVHDGYTVTRIFDTTGIREYLIEVKKTYDNTLLYKDEYIVRNGITPVDYKQRDMRKGTEWGEILMHGESGAENNKFKNSGCICTSLSIIDFYFKGYSGKGYNPRVIDAFIDNNNLWADGPNINTDIVADRMGYTYSFRYETYTEICNILNEQFSENFPALLRYHNAIGDGHTVVVAGRRTNQEGKITDYLLRDPGTTGIRGVTVQCKNGNRLENRKWSIDKGFSDSFVTLLTEQVGK